jgi:carboxypeptidase Taq
VPDNRRGALQDTHWAQGALGYFPTYALGSAWAAQLVDAMGRDFNFEATLASGDLKPVYDWLEARVWRFGRSKTAREIMRDATGSDLDASIYTRYLAEKFGALYDLDPKTYE